MREDQGRDKGEGQGWKDLQGPVTSRRWHEEKDGVTDSGNV